jgi:plasmid stabilization system protein ParE
MKVVYAERARQDIAEIYDTIASHDCDAAQRVENLIRSTTYHCRPDRRWAEVGSV